MSSKPPESIWLQWYGDQEPEDCDGKPAEVTWKECQVFDHDVEYIPAELNRNRAIATVAKIIADDPTLPNELAGALLQMCGAGGAKPYEVEE